MRILALEPYFGGSHQAFLDGWSAHSRHEWTVLGLRPSKWKWRMRHAALTFADQLRAPVAGGEHWDLIFCSDMLNLAEFIGLAPRPLRDLPTLAYFHENQLTYPVQHESERDLHFGFTNMTTALTATGVWFNSAFNRDSFLEALPVFLKRMPDYQPVDAAERIRAKSAIQPQGIEEFPPRGPRRSGPLHILWAARWEHDKDPETFFAALRRLKSAGTPFRLSVIGQQFARTPPIFAEARREFQAETVRWGYQPTHAAYQAALSEADVFVSTARHEFFGISAVEAIAAGLYPLLPRRLAYPEILTPQVIADTDRFFYQGESAQLTERLATLAGRVTHGDLWQGDSQCCIRAVERFFWKHLVPRLDNALELFLG